VCPKSFRSPAAGRLLGRSRRRLLLLAPSSTASGFLNIKVDPRRHAGLMVQLQALRGDVYVREGFLRPEELREGRHRVAVDEESWHLLLVDDHGRIGGCLRYRQCRNDIGYSQLGVSNSPLARSEKWRDRLKTAVHQELALARSMDLPYVEVGGWALAENLRGTSEALRMALATYALSQMIGGAVGITTARLSRSGPILRKIGGCSLADILPAYFDPIYRSMIEVLRFYSWAPDPRFRIWVDEIKAELCASPALTSGAAAAEWPAAREASMSGWLGFPRAAAVAAM
jgi:hypothetical protein